MIFDKDIDLVCITNIVTHEDKDFYPNGIYVGFISNKYFKFFKSLD